MKWKKLGLIFDPKDHLLWNQCKEFAQAPQAIEFDNFIRVYFSTRTLDASGKYLSHISYIEMDKHFKSITNISKHTVISLGDLGTFDEHGVFPLHIYRDRDNFYGYTSGWFRRESVLVDSAIGLAQSKDNGKTFQRLGPGPILAASLHEPFLIADPYVIRHKEKFHMWYVFGKEWLLTEPNAPPDRVYKIGHATSEDGIAWEKEGRQILPDHLCQTECQAFPTVTCIHNRFHMYFCYREATDFRTNPQKSYRLGYAFSDDLTNWTRADELAGIDRSVHGWDSEMMCYPNFFKCNGHIYLLYNGNAFGRHGFGLAVLDDDI